MVLRAASSLSALDGRVFYVGLALCMGLWACAGFVLQHQGQITGIQYDWMTRHRVHVPIADPDIVILDIDEKSLARMSGEFGRWPWPRDVLAAVLAELEAQGAQAVLFDILFSDPDRQNAASDKAFSDAIAASRHSYFSVLRLNPANDAASSIQAGRLPGLVSVHAGASGSASRTLALVPPFFAAAVASTRLGTHNVRPDADGVIRRYHLWEEVDGLRIVSLPQRLAEDLGWPAQQQGDRILQWMAEPLAYTSVSFSDYYVDSQRKARARPRNEFRGKIVIVGATAASLFDLKGTPLAAIHPGVDVLATAIDNAKNDRFLHELPRLARLGISLTMLVLMAWLSIRYSHEQMELAFLIAPSLLLALSYLSLNFSNVFIDLSEPASLSLLYFALAKGYNVLVRRYWSGEAPFAARLSGSAPCLIGCLTLILPTAACAGFETRFYNVLRHRAPSASAALNLGHGTGWLKPAFEQILVASWLGTPDDAAFLRRMRTEAAQLTAGLTTAFGAGVALRSRYLEREVGAPTGTDQVAAQVRMMIFESLGPANEQESAT